MITDMLLGQPVVNLPEMTVTDVEVEATGMVKVVFEQLPKHLTKTVCKLIEAKRAQDKK